MSVEFYFFNWAKRDFQLVNFCNLCFGRGLHDLFCIFFKFLHGNFWFLWMLFWSSFLLLFMFLLFFNNFRFLFKDGFLFLGRILHLLNCFSLLVLGRLFLLPFQQFKVFFYFMALNFINLPLALILLQLSFVFGDFFWFLQGFFFYNFSLGMLNFTSIVSILPSVFFQLLNHLFIT